MTSRRFSLYQKIKSSPIDTLFLVTTVLIFMPFYISVPAFLIASLVLMGIHWKSLFKDWKGLGWLGVFIIYAIVVSACNRNMIGVATSIFLVLFGFYFKYYRDWIRPGQLVNICHIIVGASWVLSVMSMVEYVTYVRTHHYDLLYVFKYANVQTRAEATFFNANYYGLFCIFSILISCYLFSRIQWRPMRVVYILLIGHNLVAILLTASRMLLPTLFVALIWYLMFADRRWAILIGVLAVCLGIVLAIRPDLMPRLETIGHGFQDRFSIWRTGWAVFESSPIFGRGMMSYLSFYYQFTNKAQLHAHNIYIDTLANYGVVGASLLVIALSHFIRQLIRLMRSKEYRLEVGLISSLVVSVLVHGLVDVAIVWVQTAYVFLLFISLNPNILCQLKALPLEKVQSFKSVWQTESSSKN